MYKHLYCAFILQLKVRKEVTLEQKLIDRNTYPIRIYISFWYRYYLGGKGHMKVNYNRIIVITCCWYDRT